MASPFLHRVLWGEFPCLLGTMRRSDFLLPVSLNSVSFVQGYHCPAHLFGSHASTAEASMGQEFGLRPPPDRHLQWRQQDLLSEAQALRAGGQVPGKPSSTCPALRPRWDLDAMPISIKMLPSTNQTVSAPAFESDFEPQSHDPLTPCVRFAAWITP